jgi:hypothetical protein
MTSFPKWSEVRADMVAAAGGEEAVPEARKRNQSYTDGHRLAERRRPSVCPRPTWPTRWA